MTNEEAVSLANETRADLIRRLREKFGDEVQTGKGFYSNEISVHSVTIRVNSPTHWSIPKGVEV